MNGSARQRLEMKLHAEVESASRRIIEDPAADVGESLTRIETYVRLLNARPSSSHETRIWALAIGFSCLVLVSLLAALRTGGTKLLLDVATGSTAFQVADVLEWTGTLALAPGAFRIQGLSSVDARFVYAPVATERHDGWVTIDSGRVALTRLQLADNGIVQLEHDAERRFGLFLREGDSSGELQVLGDLTLAVGSGAAAAGDGRVRLEVPESIPFSRRGRGIVPVALEATLAEDWFLKDVPVRMLNVSREVPDEAGAVAFVSAVKRGTIVLPEVSRQITLRERDHLTLGGVSGLLVEARLDAGGIHLLFQGAADRIHLGPPGYAQNLAPTYLEYLYRSQPLALFWAAATFLGGILWGVRRTLFA